MFSRKMRGFSLIEMMVVIAMILIVLAFSIMAIQPSLKQNNVTEGFNQTLMALRQARDISVAQRQIYFVTLSNAADTQLDHHHPGVNRNCDGHLFPAVQCGFCCLAGPSDIANVLIP